MTGASTAEFEPFLTAREVAERLRIAPCTVLRWTAGKKTPPGTLSRAGRRIRTLECGYLSLLGGVTTFLEHGCVLTAGRRSSPRTTAACARHSSIAA